MRKPILIAIVCVAASLCLLFFGFTFSAPKTETPSPSYALLIQDDTGTFLMQLRKGMQEAAAAQGARLAVETLSTDLTAQAQALADQGITGALLWMDDPRPMVTACEEAQLPCIVIGQEIRGQICVLSEDSWAGFLLMERAYALREDGQSIGLIAQEDDLHAKDRISGAHTLIQRSPVKVLPWPQEASALEAYDVLVAFTGEATAALADMKAAGLLAPGCQVLGVDTGDRRTEDLESGSVQAMIFDNPYAMGYMSIEKAKDLETLSPSVHTCTPSLIDTETMYLMENVKQVFPLLQ